MLIIGAYGVAFVAGKFGLYPPALAQYGVLTRGAILAASALVLVTLFSIAVGIALAHLLKWRYSHLAAVQVIQEGRSDE